jgi:hypothetical protein
MELERVKRLTWLANLYLKEFLKLLRPYVPVGTKRTRRRRRTYMYGFGRLCVAMLVLLLTYISARKLKCP